MEPFDKIIQPPCEDCLQRAIAQFKSAALNFLAITEPLKTEKGCDEGLLGMRIIAEMIVSVLNDEAPETLARSLAFIAVFWDTQDRVSNAYISLATAIVDSAKLIQQINKSPR